MINIKDQPLTAHFLRMHFVIGTLEKAAEVYINGQAVGQHQGGYTPFAFDVTDYLNSDERQEVVVRVWDHHGQDGFVSVGKQSQGNNYGCIPLTRE